MLAHQYNRPTQPQPSQLQWMELTGCDGEKDGPTNEDEISPIVQVKYNIAAAASLKHVDTSEF